ncbi:MAG: polyprenyl synthetase family protein [Candidatus Bathyarchaeia archaeon]
MSSKENRGISHTILEILREKSRNGLIYTRKIMLAEKIQSNVIRKALQYYVNNWGISTHPAPFILAYEAVGGNPNDAMEAQAAIVMLSAALDIHDDIIDKSVRKRGKLTVVGKFGSDIALLLGNAFFIKGFSLFSTYIGKLDEEKRNKAIQILKEAMFEVGDAHALEFNFRGKTNADPEEYMKILQMKAVTTQVTMQLGAIFGGGTVKETEALAFSLFWSEISPRPPPTLRTR